MSGRSTWPAVLLAVSLLPILAVGAPINFVVEGTFTDDPNAKGIGVFTLSNPSTVMIQTWSYGGGPAYNGTPVAGGNFDPVISLFTNDVNLDPSNSFLITTVDDGPCPPGNLGAQQACFDSGLGPISLNAGTYSLVVTMAFNYFYGGVDSPFTEEWSEGASFQEGEGRLYYAEVDGYEIPEPGTMSLMGAGLLAAAILMRRRR